MIIGYARVSTEDQNLSLQIDALEAAGCTKIFSDKLTGANMKRPQLTKCLADLYEGDTLIVWKADRLSRSTIDLLTVIDRLGRKGVAFKSLTEPFDTTTPTGKLLQTLIAALAQFERENIKARTKAGLEAAKKRGVKLGRKSVLTPHQRKSALKRLDQGDTPSAIGRDMGVSRQTIGRLK